MSSENMKKDIFSTERSSYARPRTELLRDLLNMAREQNCAIVGVPKNSSEMNKPIFALLPATINPHEAGFIPYTFQTISAESQADGTISSSSSTGYSSYEDSDSCEILGTMSATGSFVPSEVSYYIPEDIQHDRVVHCPSFFFDPFIPDRPAKDLDIQTKEPLDMDSHSAQGYHIVKLPHQSDGFLVEPFLTELGLSATSFSEVDTKTSLCFSSDFEPAPSPVVSLPKIDRSSSGLHPDSSCNDNVSIGPTSNADSDLDSSCESVASSISASSFNASMSSSESQPQPLPQVQSAAPAPAPARNRTTTIPVPAQPILSVGQNGTLRVRTATVVPITLTRATRTGGAAMNYSMLRIVPRLATPGLCA